MQSTHLHTGAVASETQDGETGPFVANRDYAFKFEARAGFLQALILLEELSEDEPIEYHPAGVVGGFIVVMPGRFFERILPLFESRGIVGEVMKVRPIEQQARLRGLIP